MTASNARPTALGIAVVSALALTLSLLAAGGGAAAAPPAPTLDTVVDRELASLVAVYKTLHGAPELSHHEEKTSALLAGELRAAGFTVTEGVGRFGTPRWTGYGVVGVLKNGQGPTVLVRSDMDALPVEEKTGLAYASKVRTKNDAGQDVGVMHACGHDVHMASLIGTARALSALKDRWRGTVILVGQPSEETVDGSQAMLDDDLYGRFGKPDFAIALHDQSDLEAGKVGWCPGYALASSTSVDITVRGVGGHGSRPESTKDPVVLASEIVLGLQTIVSRENSPLDPAVVTVGSIHGGTKRNIIPDEVVLQLTVRAYKEEVRTRMVASIERIARGIAQAAGIPAERAPVVKVIESELAPATWNDPALTERLSQVFVKELGEANVVKWDPVMGSEDFGRFALADRSVPASIFWLGAVDPETMRKSRQAGTPLPSLHSALFAPLPEPTLRTGVRATVAALLDLMKR